jgi:hypothetical protein
MPTLLCTFNRTVGWRIHHIAVRTEKEITVVYKDDRKFLLIPAVSLFRLRAGYFCNPKKVALEFVKYHIAMRRCIQQDRMPESQNQSQVEYS